MNFLYITTLLIKVVFYYEFPIYYDTPNGSRFFIMNFLYITTLLMVVVFYYEFHIYYDTPNSSRFLL